jgi:hypothetical protein
MIDISIYTRRERALLIAETPRGRHFLEKEMIKEGGAYWIAKEGLEEVISFMLTFELKVEVIR